MARVRKYSHLDTVYDKPEGSRIRKKKLSLFEEVRPMDVGKRTKPGKEAMDFMEEKVREAGEPYDEQRAVGLHPDHEKDLIKIINKVHENAKKIDKMAQKALGGHQKRKGGGSKREHFGN